MTNAVSGARPTVDLAYAESYFAARLYADAWTGADAGDKIKAKALFQYVVDTYPGTYIESQSSIALKELESENG